MDILFSIILKNMLPQEEPRQAGTWVFVLLTFKECYSFLLQINGW